MEQKYAAAAVGFGEFGWQGTGQAAGLATREAGLVVKRRSRLEMGGRAEADK